MHARAIALCVGNATIGGLGHVFFYKYVLEFGSALRWCPTITFKIMGISSNNVDCWTSVLGNDSDSDGARTMYEHLVDLGARRCYCVVVIFALVDPAGGKGRMRRVPAPRPAQRCLSAPSARLSSRSGPLRWVAPSAPTQTLVRGRPASDAQPPPCAAGGIGAGNFDVDEFCMEKCAVVLAGHPLCSRALAHTPVRESGSDPRPVPE